MTRTTFSDPEHVKQVFLNMLLNGIRKS